jgi:hypothetical protein
MEFAFYRVYIILPASGAEQYDHETLTIPSFCACELVGLVLSVGEKGG